MNTREATEKDRVPVVAGVCVVLLVVLAFQIYLIATNLKGPGAAGPVASMGPGPNGAPAPGPGPGAGPVAGGGPNGAPGSGPAAGNDPGGAPGGGPAAGNGPGGASGGAPSAGNGLSGGPAAGTRPGGAPTVGSAADHFVGAGAAGGPEHGAAARGRGASLVGAGAGSAPPGGSSGASDRWSLDQPNAMDRLSSQALLRAIVDMEKIPATAITGPQAAQMTPLVKMLGAAASSRTDYESATQALLSGASNVLDGRQHEYLTRMSTSPPPANFVPLGMPTPGKDPWLEKLIETYTPRAAGKVLPPPSPAPGVMGFADLPQVMGGLAKLEAGSGTALTPQQAAVVLPLLTRLRTSLVSESATRGQVVGLMTPLQKKVLEKAMNGPQASRDAQAPPVTAEAVVALLSRPRP